MGRARKGAMAGGMPGMLKTGPRSPVWGGAAAAAGASAQDTQVQEQGRVVPLAKSASVAKSLSPLSLHLPLLGEKGGIRKEGCCREEVKSDP